MPSRSEHITKANHNEQFVNSFNLGNTPFLDWVVTGLFYSAVHYVDAYLATIGSGIHPHSHGDTKQGKGRDSHVNQHLTAIWNDYRLLKTKSIDARYDMRSFTSNEIQTQIQPLLDNIRNTVNQKLSQTP